MFKYGAAWQEAAEIAEAHRNRVRRAVLKEVDARMSSSEAARLTGVSRVTINSWRRVRRRDEERAAK